MGSDSDSSSDGECYGPAPPPNRPQIPTPPKAIGPQLPPGLSKELLQKGDDDKRVKKFITPEEDSDSGEEDSIGPMPVELDTRKPAVLLPKSEEGAKPKREEWMLIPPKNREISGIGARKFLLRQPENSNKVNEHGEEIEEEEDFRDVAKKELEEQSAKKRDEEQAKILEEKGATSKKESLLEIHRKKRKMEQAKEPGKGERKAFDRNTDLQISHISDKDREKYIKKSQEIGSRFAAGKRKFL